MAITKESVDRGLHKEYTSIFFQPSESRLVPLLWNVLYGVRQGISTAKLRIHNSILEKIEVFLDVSPEQEPGMVYLEMAVKDLAASKERELCFTQPEMEYIKGLLQGNQWAPGVTRIAQKLLAKFGIDA